MLSKVIPPLRVAQLGAIVRHAKGQWWVEGQWSMPAGTYNLSDMIDLVPIIVGLSIQAQGPVHITQVASAPKSLIGWQLWPKG